MNELHRGVDPAEADMDERRRLISSVYLQETEFTLLNNALCHGRPRTARVVSIACLT